MGHLIVKLTKGTEVRFLEWSTVADAPITYGMTREEFEEHYRLEYGRTSMHDFHRRMARVESYGTSSMCGDNLPSLLSANRAGPKESKLTEDELWLRYVENRP